MKITLNNVLKRAAVSASNRSSLAVLKRGVAGIVFLAGLAFVPSTGKAQNANPQTPGWIPYGQAIIYELSENGPTVFGHNTSGQLLSTSMTMQVYKSPRTSDGLDWYLLAGPYTQTVSNASSNGWIGVAMDLNIEGLTEYGWGQNQPAALYDAQPASTTLTDHTNVSMGASLDASGDGITPGFGLSWSTTVDAPAVTVGTTNAGNIANFHFTYNSSDTEQLQYAAMFSVKHGQGLWLQVTPDAWWTYTESNMQGSQTVNLYTQGAFVADFGAAPSNPNNPNSPDRAMGPQIVNRSTGQCLTAAAGASQNVTLAACSSSTPGQHWYYTKDSQIENVDTQTCLDTATAVGTGDVPPTGDVVTTAACEAGKGTQQWQLTTTRNSGVALNLRVNLGPVASAKSGGQVALNAPGGSDATTVFYLQ